MSDTRTYYAEGLSVFKRLGSAPEIHREIMGTLVSHKVAKIVANCLNLYVRGGRTIKERIDLEVPALDAGEKGEHVNVKPTSRDLSA
jgi:hypothetical protein